MQHVLGQRDVPIGHVDFPSKLKSPSWKVGFAMPALLKMMSISGKKKGGKNKGRSSSLDDGGRKRGRRLN